MIGTYKHFPLEHWGLNGRMTVSKVLAPPYAHPNPSGGGAGVSKP